MVDEIFKAIAVVLLLIGAVLDFIRSYYPNPVIEKAMFAYTMFLSISVGIMVLLKFRIRY